jgi:hypothetical protein
MSDSIKNVVYVDIDTDRDEEVRIGKLPNFNPPTSEEEDREVCALDVKTLVEGITKMGIYMEEANYQTLDDTIDEVLEQLKAGREEYFNNKKDKEG